MDFDYLRQVVFSGLTRGSIYALLSLGYTMVYGVVRLINFAHGEVYMIGAFSTLILVGVLSFLDLPLYGILALSILVAIASSASYGYALEKVAYKPLRDAPRLSILISAIGMSMFLQNYVRLAQTSDFLYFPKIFADLPLAQNIPYINSTQVIIFSTTAIIMVFLTIFVGATRTGRSMRALSQDRMMALLCGVNVNRIITITFVIGSSTAALGGILVSSYIGQLNFYMGFLAGIKAFVAAVLGGIGSIPGAVLGSFILGLSESLGTVFISSDYEDVFAFAFLILILLFKPSGLLGRNTVEKV